MNWEDRIRHVASKHGFDPEAATFMAEAIRAGGGRSAQWRNPRLGGFGQWIPGMTTLSPRDQTLEKRLDAMCGDLMVLLREAGQGRDLSGSEQEGAPVWWPKTLGLRPDSAGTQNQVRFAYFAGVRRLAVDHGDGRVTVYDTGNHGVRGVSRTPDPAGRLVFQSQLGEDDLTVLPVVELPGE